MSKKKGYKYEKTIEEYRRDIFALKTKLQEEQYYLNELRQKSADLDIFADNSYSFPMRLKILEYTLNDIRSKLDQFRTDEAYQYYVLNYSAFALVKSCEIIGITKEMIFRAVDQLNKGEVGYFDLAHFLKETLRLDDLFVDSIMNTLCEDQAKKITADRYTYFLRCFMLQTEQDGYELAGLDEPVLKIVRQLVGSKVNIDRIWHQKELNIATLTAGLMKCVKNGDVLDCVACYLKCDPMKVGAVQTAAVIGVLKRKGEQIKYMDKNGIRLK